MDDNEQNKAICTTIKINTNTILSISKTEKPNICITLTVPFSVYEKDLPQVSFYKK